MILYPYKTKSKTANALKDALGIKFLKRTGPTVTKTVLNWGNTKQPNRGIGSIINYPEAVELAANKLKTFTTLWLNEVPHVMWTTSKGAANGWQKAGHIVLARHTLTGHSGNGISICRADDAIPDAPLYTRYVKKQKEYRVHVFLGEVIDIQQKKRMNGVEPHLIRSHKNGYVFCREGVVCPDAVQFIAKDAVRALGLDFGAVDIIQDKEGKIFVLEVNSAPGLEGQTLENYVNAIRACT